MVLSTLRGAVGFLTRVRVGGDQADWRAFTDAPWAFPVVGAGVGLLLGTVTALLHWVGFGGATGVLFLGALVALLGITHFDGIADLGDAAVVHGDAETRVAVLKDSDVGVGAVVALVIALLGTASAVASLGVLPVRQVVAVVAAAEIGAKAAMAGVACLGTARHEGLGSQFTEWNGRRELGVATLVALALWLLLLVLAPGPAPVVGSAFLGALLGGGLLAYWANSLLDGVNGDVFGAVDVAARLVGLYAAVASTRLLVAGGVGVIG
jgi:adenosylcobinamide-GDP ribazoletransferase